MLSPYLCKLISWKSVNLDCESTDTGRGLYLNFITAFQWLLLQLIQLLQGDVGNEYFSALAALGQVFILSIFFFFAQDTSKMNQSELVGTGSFHHFLCLLVIIIAYKVENQCFRTVFLNLVSSFIIGSTPQSPFNAFISVSTPTSPLIKLKLQTSHVGVYVLWQLEEQNL